MSRLPDLQTKTSATSKKWKLSSARSGALLRLVKAAYFLGKADAYRDRRLTLSDRVKQIEKQAENLADNNEIKANDFLEDVR